MATTASSSSNSTLTQIIDRMRQDGWEFYLNSQLQPTVSIPGDAFQKEWPVDSQRVQDSIVSLYYEASNGDIIRSAERDFLMSQMREDCRKGGQKYAEFEGKDTEQDVIIQGVAYLMNQHKTYEAMTAEIVKELRSVQTAGGISSHEPIPVFTNIFSRRLARLIPVLKGYGIGVTLDHREAGSYCTLSRLESFKPEPNPGQPQVASDDSGKTPSGESSGITVKQGSGYGPADGSDGEMRVDPPPKSSQGKGASGGEGGVQ